VRLLHSAARVTARFASENVVSLAGLVPVMRLAGEAGLYEQVAQQVRLQTSIGSHSAGKVAAIVAGMAAGADSIDDLDVLRHGGMDQLFGAVYAPSTLGAFLREFSFGHVRQLEAAARGVLVELAATTFVGRDRGVHLRGCGLGAAAGLRARQAGRGVRPHQGRRLSGAVARAVPAGGHDLHR
jgi:hypothetical protein